MRRGLVGCFLGILFVYFLSCTFLSLKGARVGLRVFRLTCFCSSVINWFFVLCYFSTNQSYLRSDVSCEPQNRGASVFFWLVSIWGLVLGFFSSWVLWLCCSWLCAVALVGFHVWDYYFVSYVPHQCKFFIIWCRLTSHCALVCIDLYCMFQHVLLRCEWVVFNVSYAATFFECGILIFIIMFLIYCRVCFGVRHSHTRAQLFYYAINLVV